MSTTSGSTGRAAALGVGSGMVVQELGWDSDADEALREELMDSIGGDFVYEAIEAVDTVLLWWRADDGDLGDGLVDALTDLGPAGYLWLLTPKVGRDGYVEPSDLSEAALVAGLALANPVSVARDWQAHKLVRPRGGRR